MAEDSARQPTTRMAGLFFMFCAAGAIAAPAATCLATTAPEVGDTLRYELRSDRCEGILPRYVGYGDGIDLVGFGAGAIGESLLSTEVVVPQLGAYHDPMTVRALSLTARKRYQMDRELAVGSRFRWSLELLRQAQANKNVLLDPATMGIVACSNRCASRPDTVYVPVLLETAAGVERPALALKLRADVPAMNVRVSLHHIAGGPALEPSTRNLALYPDDLTTVSLPVDMPRGEYRLEVRATNLQTRQQMTTLLGRLIVP